MAKTTISVPEGHHVEVHAPMGGAGGFSAPQGATQPGVIPTPTETGMAGAMDQALAVGSKPKDLGAPPKGEQKAEPKPKPKPKAGKGKGGKYSGPDRKKPAKPVGVGAENDQDGDE